MTRAPATGDPPSSGLPSAALARPGAWALAGLLVLALAGGLRFWQLGAWSLDGDEVYSFYDVQAVLAGEDWPHGMLTHPLGYGLMAATAWLVGLDEWGLRLGPALASLAAVAALLWMRRDVLERRVALLAAVLAATSPWLVYHGQTARFYGPQLLAATLATLWALPGPGRRPLASLAAWLLAVACHPSALLLGPALALPLLRPPVAWRALGAVLGALGLLLGLVVLADEGALILIVRRIVEQIDPNRYDAAHLVLGLGYNIGPLVGLAALWGLIARAWPSRPLLALAALLPPALLVGVALTGPSAHQRYAMASLPAWLLLAGVGLDGALRRGRVLGLVALVLALAVPAPALLAQLADGNRHDLRGVARWLAIHGRPGDAFVADEHGTLWHYLQAEPGFADATLIEDTEVGARQRHTLLRAEPDCFVALKRSRIERGMYTDTLMDWIDEHFQLATEVGAGPPPLVRHDNRYRVFRRLRRLAPTPFVEPPAGAVHVGEPGR